MNFCTWSYTYTQHIKIYFSYKIILEHNKFAYVENHSFIYIDCNQHQHKSYQMKKQDCKVSYIVFYQIFKHKNFKQFFKLDIKKLVR